MVSYVIRNGVIHLCSIRLICRGKSEDFALPDERYDMLIAQCQRESVPYKAEKLTQHGWAWLHGQQASDSSEAEQLIKSRGPEPYGDAEVLSMGEMIRQIESAKRDLASTDYQTLKYVEGEISDQEFADLKRQRKEWRQQVNDLTGKLEKRLREESTRAEKPMAETGAGA